MSMKPTRRGVIGLFSALLGAAGAKEVPPPAKAVVPPTPPPVPVTPKPAPMAAYASSATITLSDDGDWWWEDSKKLEAWSKEAVAELNRVNGRAKGCV